MKFKEYLKEGQYHSYPGRNYSDEKKAKINAVGNMLTVYIIVADGITSRIAYPTKKQAEEARHTYKGVESFKIEPLLVPWIRVPYSK